MLADSSLDRPRKGTGPQVLASRSAMDFALTLVVVGFFVLLVPMAFVRNVNWDEFHFLAQVHAWLDGRLDRPMQTFFVHGFSWLAHVPTHEIGQIAVARLMMTGLLALTCLAIWRMGNALADPFSAKVAVLAFLCSGFVMAHGTSFRADPIAACLLMNALALLLTSRMRAPHIMLVAILSALAWLVTIKSVLYLPAFLGVLIWRRKEGGVVRRSLIAGGLAVVIAAGLFIWHDAGLIVAEGKDIGSDLRDAAGTTLLSGRFLPRSGEILLWAVLSLPALALAGMGFGRVRSARDVAVLTAFALPVASLLIYRNAFPYFFPFIAAPLMVVVAPGAAHLHRSPRLALFVVAMIASGAGQSLFALGENNAAQRATLAEVHRLFPTPVNYIDQHGMVPTFPKQGFFMSSWGVDRYRRAGRPVFAAIIDSARPPLLLADRRALIQAMTGDDARPGALFPEDREILKNSYVHHAGAIWLAGRALVGADAPARFTMPFAGRYRLEAAAPVRIDGIAIDPGEALWLDDAHHVLEAAEGMPLRLIWATDVGDDAPPVLPAFVYSGFWRL